MVVRRPEQVGGVGVDDRMIDPTRCLPRRALAGALLLFAACGEPPSDDPDVERRTVAGVEVVTNHGPRDGTVELGPARVEFAGSETGEGALPVRVVGAILRDDGSLLLADQGTSELYLVGTDGAAQRTVGAEGEGPGEYQSIDWLSRYRGDSIAVYDSRLRRVTVLDGELEVARTFRVEGVDGRLVRVFGPLDSGALVADGRDFPTGSGHFRRTSAVHVVAPDGVAAPALGSFPADELIWRTDGGAVIAEEVPLGRGLHSAPVGAGFWLASTDSLALTRWEADDAGAWAPRSVATVSDPFGAGSPEAIRAHLEAESWLEPTDPALPAEIDRLLSITPHATLPAFTALRASHDGGVWVRKGDGDGHRWDRFAPDGRWIDSLSLPVGVEVLAIDPGGVVVKETLADGREVIRVHDAPLAP